MERYIGMDVHAASCTLAVVLSELQGPEAALACYERAIVLDPKFADAHYNLASLCESLGRPHDALRHYNAYRRMSQSS
jgi:tetratricopeptide (TPR) repeat protein